MATVGLMYNLKGEPPDDGEPPDLGAELDSETTVMAVAEALRAGGHEVVLIEGNDVAYLRLLEKPVDIVFNMCEGLRGESRESHIPAILEMLGIPYTGSGVLTLALTLDKALTKKVLAYHGIPTAPFKVFDAGEPVDVTGLEFPLFVKPLHEGSSMGVGPSSIVSSVADLEREVSRLTRMYKQPALVEEFLPGREFTVGILGNANPLVLPVMEINFNRCPAEHGRVYSRQFKVEWYQDEFYLCPAPIDDELRRTIEDLALRTYRVLGCRDMARIDVRLDRNGVPNVMEVNPLPGLTPGFSDFPRIAEKGGFTYVELVNTILWCALKRYGLEHLLSSEEVLARRIA